MLLKDYIAHLQYLLDEHGNYECVDTFNNPVGDAEFNEDDGEAVYVLCDEA